MPDNNDPQTPPIRNTNGQFGPGNPGKPRGATDRTSRRAARAFLEDFDTNREEFLRNLREQFPVEYARTITRIMPKEIAADGPISVRDWTPDELARAYEDVRRVIGVETDPRVAMAGLERILTLPKEGRV